MIKLVFTKNRETFAIEIYNKIIFYRDRKYSKGMQFMPKDPAIGLKVIMSRNKIPEDVVKWIEEANSGKNLEEYQKAENDEDLVIIIKKDAGTQGCTYQSRMDIEDKPIWINDIAKTGTYETYEIPPKSELKLGAWESKAF